MGGAEPWVNGAGGDNEMNRHPQVSASRGPSGQTHFWGQGTYYRDVGATYQVQNASIMYVHIRQGH